MSRLAVVHSLATIDPGSGGPAYSVPALCRSLLEQDVDVTLVTLGAKGAALPGGAPPDTRVVRAGAWTRVGAFRRTLSQALSERPASLLHDHGIWLPTNHVASTVARRLGVRRVVSPRGMLDRWALAWHGRRKRIAWRLYQHRDLERADVIHATSDAEALGFREVGLVQPIAVIPNGVEAQPPTSSGGRVGPPRVALFLSRLHPKKGLPDLVAAWAMVRPAGWELWIAGPDEDGHEATVRALVRAAGLDAVVRFLGPLMGAHKAEALAHAAFVVLPTHGENFGLVVAEALAAGVPVLTTKAAPWSELVAAQAGWWVDVGAEALAAALTEACAAPPAVLEAMGVRGRALVAARFAWPGIARRMASVYRWLAGEGAPTADLRFGSRA